MKSCCKVGAGLGNTFSEATSLLADDYVLTISDTTCNSDRQADLLINRRASFSSPMQFLKSSDIYPWRPKIIHRRIRNGSDERNKILADQGIDRYIVPGL